MIRLSTINWSSSPQWHYEFKTLPRPTGRATRVVYTEYELPKKTRQPHDVIVDSHGIAWYASFGEQILGKLDPNTGKVTDYELPLLKPTMPTGSLAARFDEDENSGSACSSMARSPSSIGRRRSSRPRACRRS